jgi:thioredoxin reductase (NADPH)
MSETADLLVVGAGPCGLAVAIAASQAGLGCIVLDRRTIVSTIERYPLQMTFFSTPERIEIGGIPFIASHEKPTRADGPDLLPPGGRALPLDIRPGEGVVDVRREADGNFVLDVQRAHDTKRYRAASVVFATGYFDNPNFLGIPGEEPAARRPLLPRGPPVLAPAGGGDRGGEQQRGRGPRVLACGARP